MSANWKLLCEGPWSRRRKHQTVVWNDQLLLLGGFDGEAAFDLNDCWSWNGQNWSLVTDHAGWSGRDGHCAVVIDGKIFVLGGTDDPYYCRNDVWASADGGHNWNQLSEHAAWPERWQHAACIHNNKIYVTGGWGARYLNDVWCSADGNSWFQVCSNAPWKPRMFHSAISFNDAIYIIGGHDGKNQLRDVWASSDGGYSWIQVCETAQWAGRQGMTSVVLDGSVYLCGGFGGSSRFNDLWVSKDCAHWTLVEPHCAWSPRQGHASAAYRGALCLLGGFDESGYNQDLYALQIIPYERSDDLEATVGIAGVPGLISRTSELQMDVPDSSMNVSPTRKKVITVSLECALDGIHQLRTLRRDRELALGHICRTVSVVLMAVNPKLGQLCNNETSISSQNMMENISCLIEKIDKDMLQSLQFETTADGVQAFSLLELWKTLPALYARQKYPKSFESLDTSITSHSVVLSPVVSAGLTEDMSNDKAAINKIQQAIARAAEIGDLVTIGSLVEQRTQLAVAASQRVEQLAVHVDNVCKGQSLKQDYLTNLLKQLESIAPLQEDISQLNSSPRSPGDFDDSPQQSLVSELSWEAWEVLLSKISTMVFDVDSSLVDDAVRQFCADMRSHAELTAAVSDWAMTTDLCSSSSSSNASSGYMELSSDCNSGSYEQLIVEMDSISTILDIDRMKLKSATDMEHKGVLAEQLKLLNVRTELWRLGYELTNGLVIQTGSDSIHLVDMKTEVDAWKLKTAKLMNSAELQRQCSEYVAKNSEEEEYLLRLEDERIDIRSLVEKASLKRRAPGGSNTGQSYRNVSNNSGTSGSFNSNSGGMFDQIERTPSLDIEDLKDKLAAAEKSVRDVRRKMRDWYREVRRFALDFAPELLHALPDLQVSGSLLGDGGFAENAKLPRRRLDEYDDVVPLINVVNMATGGSGGGGGGVVGIATADNYALGDRNPKQKKVQRSASTSRHMLLKATYDGEEVVLKGFVMHEGDQRKGLERELSILSKLKSNSVICPRAIVEGSGALDNSTLQLTVLIEYPYYRGGNLNNWLKAAPRKPWELQSVARQLLYGLMYLHDHSVIHKDVKPSNVLMRDDGGVVLTDFELSKDTNSVQDEEASTTTRAGTRGFMAPEVESGQHAVFASDMYSYGVLLFYMHFPAHMDSVVAGQLRVPANNEPELTDLIQRLLVVLAANRPTAATALMHPYFRTTFVERLMQDGEVVAQDRKLDAVRNLLHRARADNRTNLDRITVRRDTMVLQVLHYFNELSLDRMRSSLRVTFVGEPGVDEGGLLTEMFGIFFDSVFQGECGLFEGSEPSKSESEQGESEGSSTKSSKHFVLPCCEVGDTNPDLLKNLRAFGRAMVKALYEGRRIGSRLCPSVIKFITGTSPNMRDLQMFDPQTARSLQWTLATDNIEEVGMHFESVGVPDLGIVTDENKAKFVRLKIEQIMVQNRKPQLLAIKLGFSEALKALSEEAAPFMSFLSHTDWRVLLCGETALSGPQVVSCLKFTSFPKKSNVPQWLKEIVLSSSDDHLRQFLVFVTGSPSIPTSSSGKPVDINVRWQTRSAALPVAHTCFFHLDVPDYKEKDTLLAKLMFAIQNTATFEIV